MAEFGCLYSEVLLTRNAWEKRKLGEVATITMGQSPDSKNYTLNPQDHILVQGNADIKNGWVEPRVWTTQITKIAKKGSVLLSVRAPVGEVSKTAFDVVLGRGVASVGQTDFLYQYLITLKINGFWLRYSTGSTFDSINSADIKDAIIFLPEKNEQSRIAKTLNCIDNLIAATQHNIDALEQAKKALLQRLFDQSWRFKGYSDPWEKRKFKDLVVRVNKTSDDSTIPSVEFEDIISKQGRLNKDVRLKINSKQGIYFEPQDVLFGKLRPYLQNWLFPSFYGRAVGDFWVLRANSSVLSEYLFVLIQSPRFQIVANISSGTKMPRSDWNTVSNTSFPIPVQSEQRKIWQLFNVLDNLIAATQSRLSSLELLKKALLQDLFI
ncbi:restriction endonuclease subunit S [Lacticaseibacillus paracasei]|uniref:restriction endonuclease subunit S n=1 Tax=Lacticaseibacillus paracasei TaxID=1597 RepID=UPI00039CB7C6